MQVFLTKTEHDFKGFASIYNNEVLNSFNPELQLKDANLQLKIKDTESPIKNKLNKLRGFTTRDNTSFSV